MGSLFTSRIFQPYPIASGISTSSYGNLSYLWAKDNHQTPEEVFANRLSFFTDLGITPESVVATNLLHGDKIVGVSQNDCFMGVKDPKTGVPADCLVTGSKGVNLFVIVADCLAISFFDPNNNVVALAHAGFAGVDQELPLKTVRYLEQNYGTNCSDLLVWFSPALGKERSTIKEFGSAFREGSPQRWEKYTEQVKGGYRIDWIRYATDQLLQGGVKEQNIENANLDTYTDKRFFSHRRSVESGEPERRFGVVLGLE